jgi:hypothetical protein
MRHVITFHPRDGDAYIFDEEVLDLPVANYHHSTFNLPRGGHRYVVRISEAV